MGAGYLHTRQGRTMKRFSIISIVVLLGLIVSVAAWSQEQDPEHGYIGVYIDYERSMNCYFGGGGAVWLWCLPGARGMRMAVFNVGFPGNTTPSLVLKNTSAISGSEGNDLAGWSVAFFECRYDWTWIFLYSVPVNNTDPSSTNIHSEPFSRLLGYYHCDPEGPAAPDSFLVHSNIYFNTPLNSPECTVGTESFSWGAIKSLYTE